MNDRKFGYYKLECNDLDTIRETLTKEQGFDLICALVDYSRDGTVTELPADLKIPFLMLKKKVDQAHKVYEDKCNTLKENGRKGGKAKAKNAAKAAESAEAAQDQAKKFKPPTLSQFKNAVRKIVEDNEFDDVDSYDIEAFYDCLKERNWNLEGMAIQSRKDWEQIIYARFHDPLSYEYDGLFIRYYELFRHLVSAYPQLHYRWEDVSEILSRLLECWEDDYWDIGGNEFNKSEWKAALDMLATKYIEKLPP